MPQPSGHTLEVTFVLQSDAPARLTDARGACDEVLGFSKWKLTSSEISFCDRVHRDDADVAAALFSPSHAPQSGTMCLRVRHADGRIRCLQTDFRKWDEDGNALLHVRLQNASDAWAAAVRDECTNLASLLQQSEEALLFKDRNHVYTAVSAKFMGFVERALNGRPLEGLTDYDFLPEEDADAYYALEKQVLSGADAVQELREIVRESRTAWIEVREHPVRSPQGEIVGLFASAINITRRIQAEENLELANQALPEAQKLPPIGSYLMDIRRGLFATSASLDSILGIPREYPHDLNGWERLIHPADKAPMLEYLQTVISNPGRIFNREYRINRASDGETRWVQGLGRVEHDAQGQPLVMRGSLQDITERKATEAALRETKKRLELFIEHAPAALAMYDNDMRYLAVSRRWRDVYGVKDEIIGKSHYEIVPDIPERWKEAHRRGLAGESQSCDEDRFDRANGSVIWLRWEILPWRHDDETIGGIVLFVEDISERKRTEDRLKLAASVFEHASEAIFVTDLNGNIIEVNDAFTRVTGYEREEALGKHSHLLKSERHDEDFYNEMGMQVMQTGRWRGEQWFRRKDGVAFEVSSTITTVFGGEGKPMHYVALFFDITQIREKERRLQQVALYDDLTGLPNRSHAIERLRQAIVAVGQSRQMVGVIFIDLDDFKFVNEAHGRELADDLLVQVATRMKLGLREGDTLARIGGDEFLVVLPSLSDTEAASHVVDRLLRAIHEPQLVGDTEVQLSATAGATFYPQTEEVDADQLIRQAVQAMYEAKLAGKDRYHVFDAARDYNLRDRHEEIGRIRQALKANELVLHYQPKVNLATGTLVGSEALIRWQHPERGLLLPGLFLPLIEDHDLAIDVGEWVIATALAQIEKWSEAGYRISVSVNVSARHLQQANFVDRLRVLLAERPNVDPASLELEILETSTVQDLNSVSRVIHKCIDMGITVAIDDFGTGYSSLTYLKKLPATVLKLDQGFVRDMLEDSDDLAILQGVIGLSNAFRRTPVAEGVETVEQGVMLLQLGCSIAQGYGIARPMPAEQLIPWYSNWWPDARWKNVDPLNVQDWPVLVAAVELGSWMRALEQYMNGMQAAPPELDEKRCRFGIWLESEKCGSRGTLPVLRRLEALHHESHVAAREAVVLKKHGRVSDSLAVMRTAVSFQRQLHTELNRMLGAAAPPPLQAAAKSRVARNAKPVKV